MWYKDGLNFKCTECGQCCTGTPGYAWVTEEEIEAIASYLNLSIDMFCKRYIRQVGNHYALLELPTSYDCVFLKDRKCSIYPVRPKQCRTFPWWTKNLKTPEDWKEAAKTCEGISMTAPKVPLHIIKEQLEQQEQR